MFKVSTVLLLSITPVVTEETTQKVCSGQFTFYRIRRICTEVGDVAKHLRLSLVSVRKAQDCSEWVGEQSEKVKIKEERN